MQSSLDKMMEVTPREILRPLQATLGRLCRRGMPQSRMKYRFNNVPLAVWEALMEGIDSKEYIYTTKNTTRRSVVINSSDCIAMLLSLEDVQKLGLGSAVVTDFRETCVVVPPLTLRHDYNGRLSYGYVSVTFNTALVIAATRRVRLAIDFPDEKREFGEEAPRGKPGKQKSDIVGRRVAEVAALAASARLLEERPGAAAACAFTVAQVQEAQRLSWWETVPMASREAHLAHEFPRVPTNVQADFLARPREQLAALKADHVASPSRTTATPSLAHAHSMPSVCPGRIPATKRRRLYQIEN
jgi:hypothetical protein